MNTAFRIIEYERGDYGVLYTLHFADQVESELDLFLSDPVCSADPDMDQLNAFLLEMVDYLGFPQSFFEQEKYRRGLGYLSHVAGVSPDQPEAPDHLKLRLYVIRLSNAVLITGGGCRKIGGGALQNYPPCAAAYGRLLDARRRIDSRIAGGRLRLTDTGLIGDMKFEE